MSRLEPQYNLPATAASYNLAICIISPDSNPPELNAGAMAATMSAGSCLHSRGNYSVSISSSKAGTPFSSLPVHRRRRCTRFPSGIGIRINGGGNGRGWRNGRFYTEKEVYVGGSSVPTISAIANSQDSKATMLRKILESPGIHLGPACFNALSAKLVETAGFSFGFTTGTTTTTL